MSDKQLRSKLEGLKGFAFEKIPWTTPKPLHESRVAIVTTAGLRIEDDADWNAGDQGFTEIPHDSVDLTLAHYSPILIELVGFSTKTWFSPLTVSMN